MNMQLRESHQLFNKYLALTNPQLSSCHFSAIAAWQDFFTFEFKVIDECLCVFASHAMGTFLYLPPLGRKVCLSTITACFDYMRPLEKSKGVARIENVVKANALLLEAQGFRLYPRANEYVYLKSEIISLNGQSYKSQRHDINHLLGEHQPSYRPYTDEDLSACCQLYEQWAKERAQHSDDIVYRSMLDDNQGVHKILLKDSDILGLVGRVVELENGIVAYTLGYPLNCDTFVVLLEVTDLSIAGLNAFIFNRFCADEAWADFKFVNAMDDFGMPNVARSKQSYHPCTLIDSYTVTCDERPS